MFKKEPYAIFYSSQGSKINISIGAEVFYKLYKKSIVINNNETKTLNYEKDPFKDLKNMYSLARNLHKNLPIIGYLSYEALVYSEPSLLNDIGFPEFPIAVFIIPKISIQAEINKGIAQVIYTNDFSENDIKSIFTQHFYNEHETFMKLKFLENSHSKNEFEKIVREAKQRIINGEVFQIVLSRYKVYEFKGNEMVLFIKLLNMLNMLPYAYYFKLDDHSIIGASPETLLYVWRKTVKTYPIAGTRRRINGIETVIYKKLLKNPKEKAEHMMLVDLARNDLGRIAIPGSVKVTKLMYPQILPNVIHLVSEVIGELDNFEKSFDAFRSLFPAGTVSGAPKHRAMKLIWQFEKRSRGPYAGAIGYVTDNIMDFAITIRTAVLTKNTLRIQAGAGIVYDSKPYTEYIETENKLSLLENLLGV